MNKYVFRVLLEPWLELSFWTIAETAAVAVALINQSFAERDEPFAGDFYTSSNLSDARFELAADFAVNEKMIVAIEPAVHPDIARAERLLEDAGYDLQGDGEKVQLAGEALFVKPLWTEDERGVYGSLQVRAQFDYIARKYNFRIEAVLYPGGRSDVREGTLSYSARFADKQYCTGINELARALELYEAKYLQLIRALRLADPLDGVAVTDADL